MFSLERLALIWQRYSGMYMEGLGYTLLVSVLAVFLGLVLGLFVASGRMLAVHPRDNAPLQMLKWAVKLICTAYVEVFRATPMLVQVFIIYYGLGTAFRVSANTDTNRMLWGMIAVGLNSGAYMSEVIRSGIGAVPGGQMEAARSIGMSHWKAMQHVVLPQAVRNILPAMCNEFVTIVKETSILGTVGVMELMFNAQAISRQTYVFVEPYVLAAVLYFVVVFTLSKLIGVLERRLRKSVTR